MVNWWFLDASLLFFFFFLGIVMLLAMSLFLFLFPFLPNINLLGAFSFFHSFLLFESSFFVIFVISGWLLESVHHHSFFVFLSLFLLQKLNSPTTNLKIHLLMVLYWAIRKLKSGWLILTMFRWISCASWMSVQG